MPILMQLLNERETEIEFASYVNRIRIRCVCACVRVIGRLSDWRQIAPCRRLITVHNCSGHKSCGEMKFGQLVAPASTATDPKSAMLAVAQRRWARTGRTRNLCHGLASYLPPSLPCNLLLPLVVVVVVVALAVVTSPNPICSLAAIAFGSPRLVASLPALCSRHILTIRSATGQGRTGQGSLAVLNILKRVAQLIPRLIYMSHTHAHSLFLSLWAACVTPRTRSSPSTRR